jgi:hypothetical protein
MKLPRPLVLLLPAVVLVVGSSGPAAAASGATWTVVPSPNPSAQANYLTSLAPVTPADVWAVGAWYRPSATPGTLTEHWDGTRWNRVPSPNATGGYNELYGAAAISSADVWAVGYHNIALYGSEKTMALHWNGSAWRIVPTRNIGRNANEFRAVAAIASNDVWAVGFGRSTSNRVGVPLAEHWDGTRWSLVPTPKLGRGFGIFNGVVALATNDVWAVGAHADTTLVEHWDGTAWKVVSSPNGSRADSYLYAVSAAGPNDVWAVGESAGNSGGDSLVEHWDGDAWKLVASRDGSKPFTSLNGVVATGGSSVWAVGATYDPLSVVYRTFTEHWDGTAWTVVASPNPSPEYDYLVGAAAFPGGDVWAVGAADENTLAMRTTDS